MKKIAFINDIVPKATTILKNNNYQFTKIEDAEAVFIRSTNILDLSLPKQICAVGRAGVGVNTIPHKKYAHQGVVVFNSPGGNANAVKEMTIWALITANRNLLKSIKWVLDLKGLPDLVEKVEIEKTQFSGKEINNKTLGVIGLGEIGGRVANEAVQLGMNVYGYDPYISIPHAWGLSKSIKHVDQIEEIYKNCDYITIHTPLKDDTRHLINKECIEKMKDGVVIINYARSQVVDIEDIIQSLNQDKVALYVCDFPDERLLNCKNTIITPHLGGSTAESEENCAVMVVNEVMEYLERGNIINSVNYPSCNAGSISGQLRITINHLNIPNMLGQLTSVVGSKDANILKLVNNSFEDVAYTILDVNTLDGEEIKKSIEQIEGVLRVRLLYKRG